MLCSCSIQENKKDEIVIDDKVGVLHNQSLDLILNDLMQERIKLFHDNAKTRSLGSSNSDFSKSRKECFKEMVGESMRKCLKSAVSDISNEDISKYGLTQLLKTSENFSSTRSSNFDIELTSFQQMYYNKIM